MPHRINKTKSSPSIPIHIIISLIFWYGGKRENLKYYHKGSVVVTYCCITNYPKFSGLKQQTFIVSVSLDLEFGCSLAGWLCLGVFHKAAIKVSAGTAVSSKAQHELTHVSLTGFSFSLVIGLSLSSFLAVGWRSSSVPCHVCLSIGKFTTWWLTSFEQPSRRGIEAIQDGNQFFCNLILEVTCRHSYSIH